MFALRLRSLEIHPELVQDFQMTNEFLFVTDEF